MQAAITLNRSNKHLAAWYPIKRIEPGFWRLQCHVG